jgi:hypothetical protein
MSEQKKMVVVQGSVTFSMTNKLYNLADKAECWISLIPIEDSTDDHLFTTRQAKILHEMVIGTVDELVNDYREKLTRVYNSLIASSSPLWTAQWNKQTKLLETHNLTKYCLPASQEQIEEHGKKWDQYREEVSRQSYYDRDLLGRLIAQWNNRDFSTENDKTHLPTTNCTDAAKLRNALNTIIEDHINTVLAWKFRDNKLTREAFWECAKNFAKYLEREATTITLTEEQRRVIANWDGNFIDPSALSTIMGLQVIISDQGPKLS